MLEKLQSIKKFLIVAGIIISIVFLVILYLVSGKKEGVKEILSSQKKKIDDLNKSSAKEVSDLDKKKKEEEDRLRDLQAQEEKLKNTSTPNYDTPKVPSEILKTLQDIRDGK